MSIPAMIAHPCPCRQTFIDVIVAHAPRVSLFAPVSGMMSLPAPHARAVPRFKARFCLRHSASCGSASPPDCLSGAVDADRAEGQWRAHGWCERRTTRGEQGLADLGPADAPLHLSAP